MSDTTIVVSNREQTGTGPNRRLRAAGQVPAVVYGGGRPPATIEIKEATVQKLLRDAGENAVFLLKLDGGKQSRNAMIRDIQYEPHTDRLVHIDFMRVDLNVAVEVTVAIETVGTPVGVSEQGGLMEFITREIEVTCLPNEIPDHLTIEVGALEIGDSVGTAAIELPEGVTLVDDEDRIVVAVNHPKVEAEAESEDGELLEGDAAEPERVGEAAADS